METENRLLLTQYGIMVMLGGFCKGSRPFRVCKVIGYLCDFCLHFMDITVKWNRKQSAAHAVQQITHGIADWLAHCFDTTTEAIL